MDTIELRGLRVVGRHGVLAEERVRPQPFAVDLDLVVDLARAAASDELADTIDYGAVVAAAAGVVASQHFALLERLAGRIAEEVLALDHRVASVTVTVTKLRPPVPFDLASAGVRIVRARGES